MPYTRPAGAFDGDAARARTLLGLRTSAYRKEEREKQMADGGKLIETLQDLAAKYDKGQQRFTPPARKKNLRNVEFLASLILDGEAAQPLCHPYGEYLWTFPRGASEAMPLSPYRLPPSMVLSSQRPRQHSPGMPPNHLPTGCCNNNSLRPCFSTCSLSGQKRYNPEVDCGASFSFDPLDISRYCMHISLLHDCFADFLLTSTD